MDKQIEEKSNNTDPIPEQFPRLSGIGGWLIVMLIGILLDIISSLDTIIAAAPICYFSSYALILMLLSIPFLIFYIFILIAMIKKVHFFPKMYFITIIIFGSINLISDIFMYSFDLSTISGIVSSIIWVVYLKKSERVRNTFIYNWNGEMVINPNDEDTN